MSDSEQTPKEPLRESEEGFFKPDGEDYPHTLAELLEKFKKKENICH
jgi:hypothetical protein